MSVFCEFCVFSGRGLCVWFIKYPSIIPLYNTLIYKEGLAVPSPLNSVISAI